MSMRKCYLDNQAFWADDQLSRFWCEDNLELTLDRDMIEHLGCAVYSREVYFLDGVPYRHDPAQRELNYGVVTIGYPAPAASDVAAYLRAQGYDVQRPCGQAFRDALQAHMADRDDADAEPDR
jgi:hypothetical protein